MIWKNILALFHISCESEKIEIIPSSPISMITATVNQQFILKPLSWSFQSWFFFSKKLKNPPCFCKIWHHQISFNWVAPRGSSAYSPCILLLNAGHVENDVLSQHKRHRLMIYNWIWASTSDSAYCRSQSAGSTFSSTRRQGSASLIYEAVTNSSEPRNRTEMWSGEGSYLSCLPRLRVLSLARA